MLSAINSNLTFKGARFYCLKPQDESRKLISQTIKGVKKDVLALEKQGINFEFLKKAEDSDLIEFYMFREADQTVTPVHAAFINAINLEEVQNAIKRGINSAKEFLAREK